jgi:GNAT superfamily N-acetyltransferase
MQITVYGKASLMLESVESLLLSREAENNLMIGLLYRLKRAEEQGQSLTDHLWTVNNPDGYPVLVNLLNSHNLVVASVGIVSDQIILIAAEHLNGNHPMIPGIVGPVTVVESLAKQRNLQGLGQPDSVMNQRIYQISRLEDIPYSSGSLKRVEIGDINLIRSWIQAFREDIGEPASLEAAEQMGKKAIEEKSLYMWKDGPHYVSMAGHVRPTKNGTVIGYVYTPPMWRGKGYASSCVAALTQHLLDDGYAFCSLYTNLANPTSNHIYTRMGYLPIQDSMMVRYQH